jgi:hypothetical protein
MSDAGRCKTCVYWQDYSTRVLAWITDRCVDVHTDGENHCDCHANVNA